MHFDKNIPIYLQIESFIQDKIVHGIWAVNERIPSVRELATILEVNPNTVMRSYERLEREKIIYNQRGLGFSVSSEAIVKIKELQTQLFFDQLPAFFKTMAILEIGMDEIQNRWIKFNKNKIATHETK